MKFDTKMLFQEWKIDSNLVVMYVHEIQIVKDADQRVVKEKYTLNQLKILINIKSKVCDIWCSHNSWLFVCRFWIS